MLTTAAAILGSITLSSVGVNANFVLGMNGPLHYSMHDKVLGQMI